MIWRETNWERRKRIWGEWKKTKKPLSGNQQWKFHSKRSDSLKTILLYVSLLLRAIVWPKTHFVFCNCINVLLHALMGEWPGDNAKLAFYFKRRLKKFLSLHLLPQCLWLVTTLNNILLQIFHIIGFFIIKKHFHEENNSVWCDINFL